MASTSNILDIIIIGAGLSGINCAHRLQTYVPGASFAVLEARKEIGGTWDLFRFPGVRADTDLATFSFAWNPWPYTHSIAEGHLILSYLQDCVAKSNLGRSIRCSHRVLSADWSHRSNSWRLQVDSNGQIQDFSCQFLILGTGYYDHEKPLQAEIPGLSSFKGKVIHPQFWPEGYQIGNERVAVIGSGSTAITLFPALARTAAKTVLIQRSPSYVFPASGVTQPPFSLGHLPQPLLRGLERIYFMIVPWILITVSLWFPNLARRIVRRAAAVHLPHRIDQNVHFEPKYNPWEQRLCISPNGEFFQAFHKHGTEIVTGTIERINQTHILMKGGENIEADVIVTATGLRMRLGGGIEVRIEGVATSFRKRLMWNGAMFEQIPNLFYMVGYERQSWTLAVDNTALIIARLLKYMGHHGFKCAVPRSARPRNSMETQRFWQFSSTYCLIVDDDLPVYGSTGPWRHRSHPPLDWVHARWGDIKQGLHFSVSP